MRQGRLTASRTSCLVGAEETHATEAEVPEDVVQSYLGHASRATTAIYNRAGARRRRQQIGKLFAG